MKKLLPFLLLYLLHTHAQPLTPSTTVNTDLGPYFKGLRATGISRVWLNIDRASYPEQTGLFLDAAAAEGLQVIIGYQTAQYMALTAQLCNKYWNHKAVYRFNGKPVFSGFDRCKGTSGQFVDEMARLGRGRGEYLIWVTLKRPADCPGLAYLGLK